MLLAMGFSFVYCGSLRSRPCRVIGMGNRHHHSDVVYGYMINCRSVGMNLINLMYFFLISNLLFAPSLHGIQFT